MKPHRALACATWLGVLVSPALFAAEYFVAPDGRSGRTSGELRLSPPQMTGHVQEQGKP